MKFNYDPDVDALYIDLAEGSAEISEEVKPGVVLDYDSGGRLVGIEILSVRDVMGAVKMPLAAE